ncbi:MAG: cell division ATP-binding protein FtsE [Clostridiales Family XIII bacterium]|jgi:cell division transport system ATP-binding protein|nr:cell division ATP-binding protein FtsE [Clostridiales Family XIII bacterium]
MIEYKGVTKYYGENIGVDGVSCRIENGEFVFLVGPSGSGKSTFVKLLLKLIDADSGRIMYNGYDVTQIANREIPRHRRSMGIVFQDFSLLPKKTVAENVAFAMEIVGRTRRSIRRQVPQMLDLVGISAEADKFPNQISIGEQQRVAIARAIVNNPSVLIADEPTGNLDPETGWEIMRLLEQINRRGTTVIMVTHSSEIVNAMSKRVIAIRDGKVVRDEADGMYRAEYYGEYNDEYYGQDEAAEYGAAAGEAVEYGPADDAAYEAAEEEAVIDEALADGDAAKDEVSEL